ncbi:MAG: hypothetical protein N2115_08060 [bacterium]|nr:hypothetical protein [bacterium]
MKRLISAFLLFALLLGNIYLYAQCNKSDEKKKEASCCSCCKMLSEINYR